MNIKEERRVRKIKKQFFRIRDKNIKDKRNIGEKEKIQNILKEKDRNSIKQIEKKKKSNNINIVINKISPNTVNIIKRGRGIYGIYGKASYIVSEITYILNKNIKVQTRILNRTLGNKDIENYIIIKGNLLKDVIKYLEKYNINYYIIYPRLNYMILDKKRYKQNRFGTMYKKLRKRNRQRYKKDRILKYIMDINKDYETKEKIEEIIYLHERKLIKEKIKYYKDINKYKK